MSEFMEKLEQIGSDPEVMKWSGAIVLALLGFAFMRVRRHSFKNSIAFGGGILGGIILLSLITTFLF